MASYHIPEDLLPDILKRLPVKTLGRFTCVCKEWKSLISSPLFITNHFNFIPPTTYLQITQGKYTLHHPDNTTTPLQLPLPDPGAFLGVIHGVVCLLYPRNIVFWNPTVCKYLPTPEEPYDRFCYNLIGVGFDTSKNDFKAVISSTYFKEGTTDYYKVFSSREGTWREKKTMPKDIGSSGLYYGYVARRRRGCFFKGVIYWITYTKPHGLILFDCVNEEFGRMELPEQVWDEFGCPRLFIYHGLLSVVTTESHDYRSEQLGLWRMKEYGVWSRDVITTYIGREDVFRESMLLLDIGKPCEDLENNKVAA